jgi:hypothetical protein
MKRRRSSADSFNAFQAKLIYTATLAANFHEIGRTESSVEMSRMVERLSDWPIRCCVGAQEAGD